MKRGTQIAVAVDANRTIKALSATCAAVPSHYLVVLPIGGAQWELSAAGALTMASVIVAAGVLGAVFATPWNPARDRRDLLEFLETTVGARDEAARR